MVAPFLRCFACWPGDGPVLGSYSCCFGTNEQKVRIILVEQDTVKGKDFLDVTLLYAAMHWGYPMWYNILQKEKCHKQAFLFSAVIFCNFQISGRLVFDSFSPFKDPGCTFKLNCQQTLYRPWCRAE